MRYKLDPEVDYWITSDLHFGHKNILEFQPNTRPFRDTSHMDEAIISEWNSKVHPNDVVFHLGDFTFTKNEKTIRTLISRLNGTIVWVDGNHDQGPKRVLDKMGIPHYDILEVVQTREVPHVVMCHYPLRSWNRQHRGSVHLYGHCHGSIPDLGRSTDVGWDNQGGKIMNFRRLVSKLAEREIITLDGH